MSSVVESVNTLQGHEDLKDMITGVADMDYVPGIRRLSTKEIKANNWNPGYAKTLATYFEERAMQLYYHVKILKEPTHIYDPKRIIRALLSFKQTSQFDMTYKHPT